MRTAEQVTFGGSGLNRAAEIRGDAAALARAMADPAARCLLMWRGKPLLRGDGLDALGLIGMDHPLLSAGLGKAIREPVLLGVEEGGAAIFAHDISRWEPEVLDYGALGSFVDGSEQRHPDLPDDTAFGELRRVMTRLSPRDAELAATAKAIIGWHATHRFCARCGAESVIAQAGWQRDCAACACHHFPRTDPVVIMLITNGDAVLMGRSPGWPEGMYSLLAGFIEPGETMEAAVRREVMEEAGVPVGAVRYLASQPWPFPASLMFGCAGEALAREITIDAKEIEDALWVSRADMMTAFAGEHPTIKPARKGAIAHFLLQNWLADTLD
ncbi:NAD(+) diphosphatase [Antarcticimicrobium sediminis]|uniref:NAD(+) diphosphatase n=1 Tax=Antarcticimicrobium sediminis TaxID=2546227 RepID=A0A4R5ENR4_9RHOB|nr:NAD(+) diphosphatase [Antarcticimicrobium sediminis]TDE36254.1 NAD(+) diphosphatase [Antarcticimicrobium sediminis]